MEKKPAAVEHPVLPRKRHVLKKFDSSRNAAFHQFKSPKEYFKQIYIETINTVICCVEERFQSERLQRVSSVEKELVKIINNELNDLKNAGEFFRVDVDIGRLQLHLQMLGDIT